MTKKKKTSNENPNLKEPANKLETKLRLTEKEEKMIERMMNYVKIVRPDKFPDKNKPK